MIKIIIQFGVSSILLLFSTAVAWYEGSAILDNPWEWSYSTPFTQLLYGGVGNSADISQLDYFVYSAKFQPTFPIIMVLSSLYLLVLIGYYILKKEKNWFAYYLFFLGGGLFLFSYFTSNSPTVGGRIMFPLFLICGLASIATALIIYYQILNRIRMKKIIN
ncbi:YjdJ family protein [Bacillus sp. JJ1609]|uniref:YjdJ family protein n=1 Tax=Bacillus sp. JJ1609 TaxID=3122977 RepID=UPI002FFE158D